VAALGWAFWAIHRNHMALVYRQIEVPRIWESEFLREAEAKRETARKTRSLVDFSKVEWGGRQSARKERTVRAATGRQTADQGRQQGRSVSGWKVLTRAFGAWTAHWGWRGQAVTGLLSRR